MNTDPVKCPHCNGPVTVEKTDFFETHLCEGCLQYAKIIDLPTCCNRPNYQPVKFITSSQTIQVREQCSYCGNLKGNAIGGFTDRQRLMLPLADVGKRDRRNDFISGAYKTLSNKKFSLLQKRQQESKTEWFEKYNEYLQSKEWQSKRYLVLQRDNYECQACLCKKATQVHHKSYEFCDLNGSEPCFDLVSVCLPCHNRIEEMKKQNRLNKAIKI